MNKKWPGLFLIFLPKTYCPMKRIYTLVLLLCLQLAFANVSLPKFFTDNMVLQRNKPIPVWGFANAGEKIQVKFKNQTQSTIADEMGNWKVTLSPEKEGGPFEMQISGENTVTIKNILIGEVWLCSGQSNMEWNVKNSFGSEKEIAEAGNYPFIRQIKIKRGINTLPQEDVPGGEWLVSNSENIEDFTAVGYNFAKKIYNELKVPVGLINVSWGGTNIETWIGREAFENSDDFKNMISKMEKTEMASFEKKHYQKNALFLEKIQGIAPKTISLEDYFSPNFNDDKLPEIESPKLWEEQILQNFDGVVWYRKKINLTKEDILNDAELNLGMIDDNDITYFNGIEIGKNTGYDTVRKYTISKNLLKEGENIIVVKIIDTGGGGGIWGEKESLNLKLQNRSIALSGKWKIYADEINNAISENGYPSLVYNAMLHPVIPFAIEGVLWYQGESNAERANEYGKAFPLLINSWRKNWGYDFPFYFVQLATFGAASDTETGSEWAELREAQATTLRLNNTAMVVTTDIGNAKDIHPRNKKTVGNRLADIALNKVYGKNLMITESPQYQSMRILGNKIEVTFKNAEKGLMAKGDKIIGFEIAGEDQNFIPATAYIKANKIYVYNTKIARPKAVRYGWKGDNSAINLFSKEGLPAAPFRTCDWHSITKENHYDIK